MKCEKQLLDIRCERFKMACVTGDVFLLRRSGLKPGRTLAIAQHLKQWQARALMLYWLVACVAGWLVGWERIRRLPTNQQAMRSQNKHNRVAQTSLATNPPTIQNSQSIIDDQLFEPDRPTTQPTNQPTANGVPLAVETQRARQPGLVQF